MHAVNERYGPLDWRLPEAHAIYWASVGMHRCKKDEDVRRLRTAIYQSMQLSYQRGQLVLVTVPTPRRDCFLTWLSSPKSRRPLKNRLRTPRRF